MAVTLHDLETRLWGAANTFRGPVEPADFKTYVFRASPDSSHPKAEDSIDFLKQALAVANTAVQAERLEAEGALDQHAEHLLAPHIRALTQIVEEHKPDGLPIFVEDVVRDIDTIVRQVLYTGWNETQEGDRTVRKELRIVLRKYSLPPYGTPFDNAYAYIRENY